MVRSEEKPVRIVSRSMVQPAQPTSRHHFYLSSLDISWLGLPYNQGLLFYESVGQEGHASVIEKLKSSLALCLVHYYPWCGRLAKGPLPPHRLCIDCNDAGVEFVEAFADLPLSDLAQGRFLMKPFFSYLCQLPDQNGDAVYRCPLLSVQATFFSDGGLVLGIANTHVVADGPSVANFMYSCGQCTRGVSLSLPPLHNRERLAVPNPSPEKVRAWLAGLSKKEVEEGEEGSETAAQEEKNAEGNGGQTHSSRAEPIEDPLVQCILDLPSVVVKKLKQEAGESFTSHEVTCAHFWQRMTISRRRPRCEPTRFANLVDCRRRLTPPLSAGYFGNVITVCTAHSTAGKIGSESLAATARRIHDVIAATDEDRLVGFMHWLESNDNRFVPMDGAGEEAKGQSINVSGSSRIPFYQVDFGWGTPAAFRWVKVAGEGELFFLGGHPGSEPGDMEVCTCLPASVLRRLLEDPLFLAKPTCNPFADEV